MNRSNSNPCILKFQSTLHTLFHQNYNYNISIYASYANDATATAAKNKICLADFNPRIVRKRCDQLNRCQIDTINLFQSTHRTQSMVPSRVSVTHCIKPFQSTHRTQTMRQGATGPQGPAGQISIHASYANDATSSRRRCA